MFLKDDTFEHFC